MSYWTPRADAPMAYCEGGGCEQKTDCRRWLERADLQERGATALPIKEQWQIVKAPMEKPRQACGNLAPRKPD